MLTLVQIPSSPATSTQSAALMAAYLAFDRRRTSRRQYTKAFGGMAMVVLFGAAIGRVPIGEAWIVAGLLILPPLVLGTIEAVHWRRLMQRLDQVRGEVRAIRKS